MGRVLEAASSVGPPPPQRGGRPSGGDAFRTGDKVVLAGGPYQGTSGIFLGLTADAKWADVTELNGNIRSHPVEWLSRSAPV